MVCRFSSSKKTAIVIKNKSVLLEADWLHTVLAVELHSWRTGIPWGHLQRDTLSSSCQTPPAISSKCPERREATPNPIRQHCDLRPKTVFWPHSCQQPHWHLRQYHVITTYYTAFTTFSSSIDVHSFFGGLGVRKRRGLPGLSQEIQIS